MTQPTYSSSSPDIRPITSKPKRKGGTRFTSGHLLMVVSGLLAFLLSIVLLTSNKSTVVVYVAKNDIVAGKIISPSLFIPKQVASSSLNGQYVSEAKLTSDKKYYSSRSINAGEPLMNGALTPQAEKTDVRLLSIPIDRSLAVAGALARGDRIDIIDTSAGCATRVLSNLEVVDTPTSSGGGALGGGSSTYTITVALEKSGQDLTLAGVIASGKFQVVKTTGAQNAHQVLTDPYCESGGSSAPSTTDDSVGG